MKKIWINIDPDHVDFSYLREHFAGRCEILAKAVPNDPDQYLPLAKDADVIISGLETWNRDTLAQIRGKVGFIQRFGMGTDNIDIPAASENGILVANILGANSAAVAEIAFLHILNAGRKFVTCVNQVKAGNATPPAGTELDGKTVGLLGFGNIARHLARMMSGFQVKVLAYDPYAPDPKDYPSVEFVSSREEIFRRSDIVSLHIPCTRETMGSVNKDLFDLMKDGAYLINTCRGGVVNEADLIAALRSGKLAGAGLDVICNEPPRADEPLLQMPNVYVTSHMGAESREAIDRSLHVMAEAIDTYLAGGTPKFARNADQLQK